MNIRLLSGLAASALCGALHVAIAATPSREPLLLPQKRAATYEEVRKHQELGSFVVSPDASFFVFEWSRPYDWAPNYAGVARAASLRQQTFLYRVSTPDEWAFFREPASEPLFPPAPGATYYLGKLSADGKRLSFYELDWDDKSARAGVVLLTDTYPAAITWLDLQPDDGRLDQPAVWLSNETLVYPLKGRSAALARGNAITGKAQKCEDCPADIQSRLTAGSIGPRVSSAAKTATSETVVAQSPDGKLKVLAVDTPALLSLSFRKNDRALKLFENSRDPQSLQEGDKR